MLRTTLTHPKLYDLMARLNCSRPEALGYLALLWDFTADVAPRGNIGKWPDGSIARAIEWTAEPSIVVTALVESGWLEADAEHRLIVHDWSEHCQRWVHAKLKKSGETFVEATAEATAEGTVEPTVEGTVEPSLPLPSPFPSSPSLVERERVPGRMQRPDADEVRAYASEKNLPDEASGFLDHYTSNGWKVGKNSMKDWKAAYRNWCRRQDEFRKDRNGDSRSEQEILTHSRQRIEQTRKLNAAALAHDCEPGEGLPEEWKAKVFSNGGDE